MIATHFDNNTLKKCNESSLQYAVFLSDSAVLSVKTYLSTRRSFGKELAEHGFDIRVEAERLEEMYEEMK